MLDTYAEQGDADWRQSQIIGALCKGWPIAGLAFMWGSGVLALLHRTRQRFASAGPEAAKERPATWPAMKPAAPSRRSRVPLLDYRSRRSGGNRTGRTRQRTVKIGLYAAISSAAGLAVWLHWAADGKLWWKALDYRRWVGPLTAPFFVLVTLEVYLSARRKVSPEPRKIPLRLDLAFVMASGACGHLRHRDRIAEHRLAEDDQSAHGRMRIIPMRWTVHRSRYPARHFPATSTPLDH